MTKFTKYIEGNLSDEDFDAYSKQLIVAKLDRDKRKEWERKLKEEYGVEKTKSSNKFRFLFLAIAASVLIILSIFAIPYYTAPNYLTLVDEEISNLSIMSDQSVLRKGKQDISAIREAASLAYVAEKYEQSILLWQQINASQKMIASDCFYLGLCHLKREAVKPEETIFWLQKAKALDAQRYQEEITWVLSLAYLKNGEKEKAKLELRKMINDFDYKAAEAKSILELLE